ncbi:hypothetical protein BaRGS_00023404 [Batillaria attramentaria]|uniref:Nucleoporin NDC1 n=1 Tax=Batillaria attramentaria TaxID=370345 RepID=A0ABD0KDU4_9CAEN
MDSVVYWYKTEVYFWRSAGSLFWSILCLPPLTVIYVFLCNLSLLHPLSGFSGFLSEVLSVSFILLLGLITAVLIAVACTATFTVVPEVAETRLQSFLGLLRWSRLLHALVCVLGGSCVAWCSTHFMGDRFSGLTSTVVTSGQELLALNESHLFVVLSGATAGLFHYASFHLQHQNYLAFPTLQRDKYFRVRGGMVEYIGQCCRLMWLQIRIFYLFYWLLGGTYRAWVIELLNLHTVWNTQPLDTIFGLLDISLLWQTALCSLFIMYTWGMAAILYRVYHTQHLAFLDLSHLSQQSASRRQEVFSLSQPGGHPHTWRAVCSACLQQVEALTSSVHTANLATLASVPLQHPAEKIFTTAGCEAVPSASVPQTPAKPVPLKTKLYSALKDKPVLSYFLMELPDAKSRQLFAACQIQIWAIEALSHLAAASYTEDKYGVVQQTLTPIFTSLVSLQDHVEKHFKLQPTAVRRSNRDPPPQPHDLLRQQLRVTLKTAVYRLTNKFGRHFGDLQLSGDCMKRLRPFMDYKE